MALIWPGFISTPLPYLVSGQFGPTPSPLTPLPPTCSETSSALSPCDFSVLLCTVSLSRKRPKSTLSPDCENTADLSLLLSMLQQVLLCHCCWKSKLLLAMQDGKTMLTPCAYHAKQRLHMCLQWAVIFCCVNACASPQWWSRHVNVSAMVVWTQNWLSPSSEPCCQVWPHCGKWPLCFCIHNKLLMMHLFIHVSSNGNIKYIPWIIIINSLTTTEIQLIIRRLKNKQQGFQTLVLCE